MARSNWIGGPLLALALATSAWGQSPAKPTSAAKGGERIITLQELDLPPQKCRVVKAWKTPDGMQAYQVQSLETNEMLTVVESGETVTPTSPNGPKVRAVATRIFHWGNSDKPPAGCPVAPVERVAQEVKPAVEKTTRPTPPVKPVGAQELQLPPPSAVPSPSASKPIPKPTTPAVSAKPTGSAGPKAVQAKPAAGKTATSTPVQSVTSAPRPVKPVQTTQTKPSVSKQPTVTTQPLAQMPEADTDVFPGPQGSIKVGSTVPTSSPRHATPPAMTHPSGVAGKMWPAAFADQPPHPAVDPVVARQVKPKEQTKPSEPVKMPVNPIPASQSSPKPQASKAAPPSQPVRTVAKPEEKPVSEAKKPSGRAEAAPPSDWRKSWGKVESKPVEPVDAGSRRPLLSRNSKPASPPQPKSRTVDPLAMPDSFGKTNSSPSSVPAPSLTPAPSTTVKVETVPSKSPAAVASKPAPTPPALKPAAPPGPPMPLPPAPVASKPAPTPPTVTPTKAETPRTGPSPVVPATTLPPAPPGPPVPTPLSSLPPMKPAATPTVAAPAPEKKPAPTPVAEMKPMPTPATPVVSEVPSAMTTVPDQPAPPLGAASVIAAGDTQYVPVPVVTVPDVRRVPRGPMTAPPQAPQPNRAFVAPNGGGAGMDAVGNAFTNPGPSRPIPTDQGKTGPMGNAFIGPDSGHIVQAGQQPMPMPPQGMPYPPRMAMAPPQLVPGQPTLTPQLIPGMAQGPYQPAASPIAQGGPMPQSMGYPAPMMPQHPMMPQQPMQQMQPVGYRMAQPAPAGMPTLPQTVAMLNQSDYPSQREWAAEQLSELDWKQHPNIVQALTSAARHDPAPLVRCACVRALARMGANAITVMAAVEALQNDPDPRVRDAASESLTALKGSADSGVRQAGVRPQ